MAELFRIKAVAVEDEWQDSAGSCLFYVDELNSNVDLPPDTTRIDAVAHSRPASDRFRAQVVYRDVLALRVQANDCQDRQDYHALPLFGRRGSNVGRALRKARLGVGTVIYLQVEY